MDNISFKQLPQITGGELLQAGNDSQIRDLIIDSRKSNPTANSLFFAIAGGRHDGHNFIKVLYDKGCRNFIIERDVNRSEYSEVCFLKVRSSIEALQKLVATQRDRFSFPIIGITGSNGKTIVKEWLYTLLSSDFNIIKNPGSYNSQLGVPLSVWPIAPHHTLGIFEAGISRTGEMERLEKIIKPTIGIFTNVLSAHDEGFSSRIEKATEKLKLFKNAEAIIYCKDHLIIDDLIKSERLQNQIFSWGYNDQSNLVIKKIDSKNYQLSFEGDSVLIEKEFSDLASWENLFHCVATMIYIGYSLTEIQSRLKLLKSLPMRLEMKAGVNGSTIIDDSYSNDVAGLTIALDFFESQRSGRGVVFLSDMLETGLNDHEWINQINDLLQAHKIDQLITIGPVFHKHKNQLALNVQSYLTVDDCIKNLNATALTQSTVLIKGARLMKLERLVQYYSRKIHGTIMEIDLNCIVHNLNVFRSQLKPETKIMAMVKAFAYGSGSNEVASLLQYHKADYLGVAYADEGRWLRMKGIYLPIMVMNPSIESLNTIIEQNLEPSIYSITILNQLIEHLNGEELMIHLKFDTGMHRLGFERDDINELSKILLANKNLKIKSIYSHLSGSDESIHDNFTDQQVKSFNEMIDQVRMAIPYPFLKHILNSAGISRLSKYQFDMVRLGIGLYGVDPGEILNNQLIEAITLKTSISQIKVIKKGETVGYGRHGHSNQEMKIATLSIGYADGFSRAFSKGVGKVLFKGKLAPVIGNVCMDMTMVDITGIDAQEGDEVIVYGKNLPVAEVARYINTIPYEILTSTSDRVKRVFVAESI